MKLIVKDGMVTFLMRAGKDMVKSQMYTKDVSTIINNGKNVVETDNEIIVDDKYFFPTEKEKKSHKKDKVSKDV